MKKDLEDFYNAQIGCLKFSVFFIGIGIFVGFLFFVHHEWTKPVGICEHGFDNFEGIPFDSIELGNWDLLKQKIIVQTEDWLPWYDIRINKEAFAHIEYEKSPLKHIWNGAEVRVEIEPYIRIFDHGDSDPMLFVIFRHSGTKSSLTLFNQATIHANDTLFQIHLENYEHVNALPGMSPTNTLNPGSPRNATFQNEENQVEVTNRNFNAILEALKDTSSEIQLDRQNQVEDCTDCKAKIFDRDRAYLKVMLAVCYYLCENGSKSQDLNQLMNY